MLQCLKLEKIFLSRLQAVPVDGPRVHASLKLVALFKRHWTALEASSVRETADSPTRRSASPIICKSDNRQRNLRQHAIRQAQRLRVHTSRGPPSTMPASARPWSVKLSHGNTRPPSRPTANMKSAKPSHGKQESHQAEYPLARHPSARFSQPTLG